MLFLPKETLKISISNKHLVVVDKYGMVWVGGSNENKQLKLRNDSITNALDYPFICGLIRSDVHMDSHLKIGNNNDSTMITDKSNKLKIYYDESKNDHYHNSFNTFSELKGIDPRQVVKYEIEHIESAYQGYVIVVKYNNDLVYNWDHTNRRWKNVNTNTAYWIVSTSDCLLFPIKP